MSITDKIGAIKEIITLVTSMLPKIVDLVCEIISIIKETKTV